MPALRGLTTMAPRTRRRSSLAFTPTKPGVYSPPQTHSHHHQAYHLAHLPPRPISFAPNVTPVSYNANSSDDELDDEALNTPPPLSPRSQQPKLFPPSDKPAPPAQRKRCPPGRRRSQGYIPRPPNAFMLFRADFVRQKHVPGSIETNHTSLSKIIGNCWRNLPLDEKKVWEHKAKIAKNDHKAAYPDYRFRPVHKKSKKLKAAMEASRGATPSTTAKPGKAPKVPDTFEEEMRCEEVTQLLLQGLKGEELRNALDELEKQRGQCVPHAAHPSQQLSHSSAHLEFAQQGNNGYVQDAAYGQESGYGQQDGASYVLEHDSSAYGQQELGYAPPTQMMQQLHIQDPASSYDSSSDPYALPQGNASLFQQQTCDFIAPHQHVPSHLQLDQTNSGGMYGVSDATPSTAVSGGLSAPQPTYPAAGSVFGLGGGFANVGGNAMGVGMGMGGGSVYMQRRPSSVPALPTAFGAWAGGDWDMGAVDDTAVSAGSIFGMFQNQGLQAQESVAPQHQQPEQQQEQSQSQQQQQHPHTSDGIAIPSVPFLAPPSSAGLGMGMGYVGDSWGAAVGRRMSLAQRMVLGQRRSSSAGAAFGGIRGQAAGMVWGGFGGEGMGGGSGFGWMQAQGEREIERDDGELPEADLSLFDPSFLSSGVSQVESAATTSISGAVEDHHHHHHQQGQGKMATPSPPRAFGTTELLGPLDVVPPHSHSHSRHQSHSHSHSLSRSHQSHHSTHPSIENLGGLQFQVNVGEGKEGVSPVERYEQMYLAERGAYGMGAGEYGVGEYGWGVGV